MPDWLKLPTLERSDDERKELRVGRGLVRYMKKGGSRSRFRNLDLLILEQVIIKVQL